MASDNKPSDQDGGAGDTENYALAFVSVLIRLYGCAVASKTSSTEHEDEGRFDPKLRGRHRLNKNIDATHFIHLLCALFFGLSAVDFIEPIDELCITATLTQSDGPRP